jgi:hypothetical protein
MFGAKVAMGIDVSPRANSGEQQRGAFRGKAALGLRDPLHPALGKAEAGVEQHTAVVPERLLPSGKILFGVELDPGRMRVKRAEPSRDPIDLLGLEPAPMQSLLQRRILLEPAHHHQPIDNRSVAGDGETGWRDGQRTTPR